MKRIYNGFTTALERSCRLPSGSLPTGEGGGRGRVSSDFQVQSYNAFSSIQKFCLFLLR